MSFAHLRHLRSLLEGVHAEFSDAEQRVKSCQRSLDEAKTALNIAELETRTLARSRDGLQRAISEAMRAVQCFSLLPDEILSLIFAHAAAGSSESSSNAAGIDWTLARLPQKLRLVCKRWDAVALTTRELWTYIAIPATLEVASGPGLTALPAYLALQLTRSGSLPLVVVIDAEFYYNDGGRPSGRDAAIYDQQEFLRKLFDVFATPPTVARIRLLTIHGGPPQSSHERHFSNTSSYNNIRYLTMGLLRLPTPLLEEAHLVMDYEDCEGNEPWITPPTVPQPVYFPVAPKLRVLNLAYMPVLCCPPHPGLPSLRTLWITFRLLYKSHILGMLSLCPALREIDVSVDDFETDPPPGTTSADEDVLLAAPTVKIGPEECSVVFLQYVSLDNVTSLSISPWQLLDVGNLHPALARTLTELRLEEPGDLRQEMIGPLGVFSLLKDVALLTDSAELGPLVDCLCRDDTPMWPHLTNLKIGCPVGEHGGAELVRLAQHRASSAGDRAELELITVKEREIANWVAVQLRSVLGDEKVILVDRIP